MEIRTIVKPAEYPGTFDRLVNEALRDGWTLKKREAHRGSASNMAFLYAELVKDEEDEPVKDEEEEKPVKEEAKEFDPVEAIIGLSDLCDHLISPDGLCKKNCPIYVLCYRYFRDPPRRWEGLEK